MHDAPPVVQGTPSEVRDRLSGRLVVMRSLWFPSRRDLHRWDTAGVPAYVRWLPDDGIEIGPRLGSMWAACFSPVLRGTLQAEGRRTKLSWRRTWPRFTLAVLALWAVVLLVWMGVIAVQLYQGTTNIVAVFWWNVLALASLVGPWLGHTLGGRALDEAERWVREAAATAVEEDW